jgi:LmbE family N-acetylglucosaminyl deacetylase
MATLVVFHAHPDDEAIITGGTVALAADAGHRVVLVLATRGELGEVAPGVLAEGETLGDRRLAEQSEAASILGVQRVEWLGYRDSGMVGAPDNDDPACFWRAEVEEAAGRLAGILREEGADVLTVYDEQGIYGHPDHVQVHRVGVRAAELAGTARVYEATVNRDRFIELLEKVVKAGLVDLPATDGVDETMGLPAADITHALDVTGVIDRKRAAMAAHASQIPPESLFLTMPPEYFVAFFGAEHYRLRGAPPGTQETSLL